VIAPTPLAVVLAILGAPLALLLGVAAPQAWPLGFMWIAIVAVLIAADAVLAADRRSVRFFFEAESPAYIGSPIETKLRAEFPGVSPRLISVQLETNKPLVPAHPFERAVGEGGRFIVTAMLNTVRRGAGRVEAVWVDWQGPLGLVSKRRVVKIEREIPILPDIRAMKREAIRIFAHDTTIGQKEHIEAGGGSEFDSLREFLPGMDRRNIDWKQSARHTQLLAKEFRTEQDQTVVFAIDTGRLMAEPVERVPKIDLAINSALLLAYVSLRMGDRVALFGFDAKPNISTGAVSGLSAFPTLQRLAARLEYSTEETNYTLGLTRLSLEIRRRSLIVIFTDFVDPTSAELMIETVGRLMRKHVVIFVVIRDAEIEALVQARPTKPSDISRAVIAHSLQIEKEIVLTRLQRLGAEIVNVSADQLGPEILNRYISLKQRSAI
jgi:uncharacterized protein (DUF58 family)